MNNQDNGYCRLCAESKPLSKLTDLESDSKMCNETINKITRLCNLDFNENILPKTVCIVCVNSLNRAFNFVAAVERAQVVLNDIILSQSIKKEVVSSDSDNFIYEEPDENIDIDDTIIKLEVKKGGATYSKLIKDVSSDTKDVTNSETKDVTSSEKKEKKKNISGLDEIPLSHLHLSWKDYNWTCADCETQFPNISELTTHSMEYHKSCNAYRCTDCNIRKLRLDSFLIHVRRHRKYLKLSCYKCLKKFSSPHETNKHKPVHMTSEFICPGCNTNFSSSEELKKHTAIFYKRIRSSRNIPVHLQKDNLTCTVCKKKLKTKTSLHTHLLTHTERKRDHICDVCGKSFLLKQTLASHMTGHSDERPFRCEICKSSFRTKTQLCKHVSVHDGVKPFSCEQCGRCFRLKRQLKSHSIIHTDTLPYVCSYCNKSFRFKTILNLHLRQHTGVKPYSCDICPRDFTNWPNYNKHMKRRHSMDMAKKKHTPDGVYPIDPATGQVIYPEMDKVLEWKKKILGEGKPGRPKVKNEKQHTKIKTEEHNNN